MYFEPTSGRFEFKQMVFSQKTGKRVLPKGALDVTKEIEGFKADFPEFADRVVILDPQRFEDGADALDSVRGVLDNASADAYKPVRGLTQLMVRLMFKGGNPVSVNVPAFAPTRIIASAIVPSKPIHGARYWGERFVLNHGAAWRSGALSSAAAKVDDHKWQHFILHHEIGHAITMTDVMAKSMQDFEKLKANRAYKPHMLDMTNHAENLAESYATQRYMRDYDINDPFPTYMKHLRALGAVHSRRVGHFTCRGIEAAQESVKMQAIQGVSNAAMTPQNMRCNALHIAQSVAVTRAEKASFNAAFRGTGKHFKNPNKAIDFMGYLGGRTKSPFVHEMCKRYLDAVGALMPAYIFDQNMWQRSMDEIDSNNISGAEPEAESWVAYNIRKIRGLYDKEAVRKAEKSLPGMKAARRSVPRL